MDRVAVVNVRRFERYRLDPCEELELLQRLDLDDLQWERLLDQTVIVRVVETLDQFAQSGRPKYLHRLPSTLRVGRMFRSEQVRGKAAAVVEVEMRDPERIKIRPVQTLLCHPVDCGSRAVKQDRTAARFEPISRAASFRVRHRSARTEDDQFHISDSKFQIPNSRFRFASGNLKKTYFDN